MKTENQTVEIKRPQAAAASRQVAGSSLNAPRRRRGGRLAAFIILVILVALAMFWSWWLFGRTTDVNADNAINTKEFQAVFLTNGQVYFGKLSDLNHKYVTLTDIYYLQVQTTDGSLQNASSSTSANSQVSLAKLGSELHGPEDKMNIASDQVLFWENLKPSGKVSQAISKYQQQ